MTALWGITARGGGLAYALLAFCLVMPCLSLAYLGYVYLTFRIYQESGSRILTKGEEVPYRFLLTNECPLVDLHVKVDFYQETSRITKVPEETGYTLYYKEQIQYDTTIMGCMRGEHPAGIRQVEIVDFLCLFRLRYQVPGAWKLQIRPRIPQIEQLHAGVWPGEMEESTYASQKEEPDAVVRPYVTGDDTRRIHWKASARTSALQVRETTGQIQPETILYLDRRSGSAQEEDTRLEILLALGAWFLKRGIPYTLCYPERKELIRRRILTEEDFHRSYEELSFLPFDGEGPLPSPHGALPGTEGTYGYYVMGAFTDQDCEWLLQSGAGAQRGFICSISEKEPAIRRLPGKGELPVRWILPGTLAEDCL